MSVHVAPPSLNGSSTCEGLLAESSSTSLSQCAGHRLDAEKQQDEEKRAPTESRDLGLGPLLFHFVLFFSWY